SPPDIHTRPTRRSPDLLLVGEELNGIAPLRMHHAEEAALPAGKREVGHGRGHADVDTHVARRYQVAELARRGPAGREDRARVPRSEEHTSELQSPDHIV